MQAVPETSESVTCAVIMQNHTNWRQKNVTSWPSPESNRRISRPCKTQKRKADGKLKFIDFQKPGEKAETWSQQQGTLGTTNDWQLQVHHVDLHRQLKFPSLIAATSSRPDIVLWSIRTRQVVILELTVPWEERTEAANERKRNKYSEPVKNGTLWKPESCVNRTIYLLLTGFLCVNVL